MKKLPLFPDLPDPLIEDLLMPCKRCGRLTGVPAISHGKRLTCFNCPEEEENEVSF